MKYEKKYYDMAALQCEEICEELLREKARLTEEEWEAEAQALEDELEKLKRRCEEKSKTMKKEPDEEKKQAFKELSEGAIWMAEYLGLNITVDEPDEFLGKIILEAKEFMLIYNSNRLAKKILCSLVLEASNVYVGASSDLCRMEFDFSLYREVALEQK